MPVLNETEDDFNDRKFGSNLTCVEDESESGTFPRLPKSKVVNMVLAFYGFFDEVDDLMQKLSHATLQHSIDNKKEMSKIITNWKPEITGLIEFGDKEEEWNNVYPTVDQIKKYPRDRLIKLKTIRYK